MKKVNDVIKQCSNGKYSQDFINVMINMLQLDERDRPDFIELDKIMKKWK